MSTGRVETIEEWRDSITLSGSHMVSNLGRIKRIPRRINSSYGATRVLRERISRHEPKDGGYKRINLTIDGAIKGFLIHRLVAEAFIKNPLNLPFINHKDGDKLNNRIENLEWCTHQQNMMHAAETGLSNCRVAVCSNKSGFGYWYASLEKAMKHSGVSKPCICAAAKKNQRTAGGMIWNYAPIMEVANQEAYA